MLIPKSWDPLRMSKEDLAESRVSPSVNELFHQRNSLGALWSHQRVYIMGLETSDWFGEWKIPRSEDSYFNARLYDMAFWLYILCHFGFAFSISSCESSWSYQHVDEPHEGRMTRMEALVSLA